jgi:GNAT superfamily N-acetyltransferase
VTISIDDLEHAATPGWRALEEDRLGDWLLRAASGFTGRANSALAARAAARGATGLYLQVTDDNHGARALYRRLGFTDHHGYHYRIARC